MTSEQFTYWLQGKLEGRSITELEQSELKSIQDHLWTVFNKVTPQYTGPSVPTYIPPNNTGTGDYPPFPPTVIC